MIELLAPAKVNLTLRVTGERPDGYHDIESVVQAVDLCDRLTFADRADGELAFACDRPGLEGPDNLAWRAARLLRERQGVTRGADITLGKRIPAGAGLGGGSSDAAATLVGLDRLWGLALPRERLAALAAELGSDVPLFLYPSPVLMSGRGELVEPCPWRIDAHFLIVYPGFPVSTAWAYRNFRLTSRGGKDTIPRLSNREMGVYPPLSNSEEGEIPPDRWGKILVNDLEEGVLPGHPAIAGLKEQLLRSGARASLMSGSGSSVFGLFDDPEKAKKAALSVSGPGGREVFLARPLFGLIGKGKGTA